MPESQLLPPLMVTDAERLVRDMERAMAKHRRWVATLQTIMVCRTKPRRVDLAADGHARCGFGRWLSHDADDYLKNHPGFAGVDAEHRRVHAAARVLAAAVRDNGEILPAQHQAFVDSAATFKASVRGLLADARELLRHTDPLTGVANRFAMLPRLEQERQRIRRSEESCSVCMVDIDRFKRVSDTYGHTAGDLVLQGIARFMAENLRRYDQVCRYGGEEFLLMLPTTAPEKAQPVIDRLRRGMAREEIAIDGGQAISVTASFGIAPMVPRFSVLTAIDRADKAMYAAKKSGRNRVCIWKKKGKEKKKKN